MPGGTWSPTDLPVLPGLYMNFQAAALASIQPGARGIVIAPVKANWGPVRQFVEITSESGLIDSYTQDETGGATAYTTGKLALLGGAKKVLLYRLAAAAAAKATKTLQDTSGVPVNVLRLDAKYEGTRGNNFTVTVQTNAVDATKKDIKLYEGATLLRTFTAVNNSIQAMVDAINNDTGNKWITATFLAAGNGTLADVTNVAMTGGDSGITGVVAADYTNALTTFETQIFNILTLDGISDSAIQTSVVSWIDRLRTEGKGIQATLGGSATDDTAADAVSRATTRSSGWNHEGVVNVGVGGILDGVSYSSAQTAAWVAGLIAGQKLSESTTYAVAPFSDVTRRWTRSEQESAANGGVFLLIHDGTKVKVLRGINTLTTLGTGQNNAWKKIRSIRVMDAINGDLLKTAEDTYIGKVNNTEEGRLALIGAFKQYMQTIAASGLIESTGWDVYLHPDYYGSTATLTPATDQVYVKWDAKITDVVEQIFGEFIVQ